MDMSMDMNMARKGIMIRLDTIEKVKDFCGAIAKSPCDCDLEETNSRHVVDAKSIMGIFSLDLTKDLRLVPSAKSGAELESAMEAARPYMIEGGD